MVALGGEAQVAQPAEARGAFGGGAQFLIVRESLLDEGAGLALRGQRECGRATDALVGDQRRATAGKVRSGAPRW